MEFLKSHIENFHFSFLFNRYFSQNSLPSMFEFHEDKEAYFNYQYQTSKDHIIPFIQSEMDLHTPGLKILEIGCGEAGVLKAFTDLGHTCLGIELFPERIENAKKLMAKEVNEGSVNFIVKNIYDINPEKDLAFLFDLIILKDVIEHIPNQDIFLTHLKKFLNPGGKVFFGFPPWQMPFGGHQQMCRSKILSRLPYFHLLPAPLYKLVMKGFGEPESVIQELSEIKRDGISIETFEKINKENNFRILKKKYFLFNPIYQFKFGLKPKTQFPLISNIPVIRNFFTTCAYYLTILEK